jgi:hypothetical protein
VVENVLHMISLNIVCICFLITRDTVTEMRKLSHMNGVYVYFVENRIYRQIQALNKGFMIMTIMEF